MLIAFAERASKSLFDPEYNYAMWLHGKKDDPFFPLGGGDSLGFALVGHSLAINNMTASESIYMKPTDIIKPWLDGKIDLTKVPERLPRLPLSRTFVPPETCFIM